MADEYCTDEEVQDVLPEYDPGVARDRAAMDRIRARVSRRIDRYMGAPPYGAVWFPAADADPSDRVFYGDGSGFLPISPHLGDAIVADDVSMPTGYMVPSFVERDGYLVTTSGGALYPDPVFTAYGALWPAGVAVTVSARWGYAAAADGTSGIPGDVVEAAVILCVASWRQRDQDPDLGGSIATSYDLPPVVRETLDRLRARRLFAGVA